MANLYSTYKVIIQKNRLTKNLIHRQYHCAFDRGFVIIVNTSFLKMYKLHNSVQIYNDCQFGNHRNE